MSQNKNGNVVFESDALRLTRYGSGGRDKPAKVRVEMLKEIGPQRSIWTARRLDLTTDDLFDLTEALDDLCDHIEDQLDKENK